MQLTPVREGSRILGYEEYPINMIDFMDMFPNEEACLEYLSLVRWPEGYACLKCSSIRHWKKARGLYSCQDCGYEASVIVGTIFKTLTSPYAYGFKLSGML